MTSPRALVVTVFTLVLISAAFAQEDGGSGASDPFADPFSGSDDIGGIDDIDSFFDDPNMIEEVDTDPTKAPEDDLLVREDVRIGGNFSSTFRALGVWEDYPNGDTLFDPTDSRLVPSIAARIFLDARPANDYRFFAKFELEYPFQLKALAEENWDAIAATPAASGPPALLTVPSIRIFELFSDFTWRNALFFRIGKSVVNWGVGYFYSPADLISLTPINPEDPEAEREGPLSFRTHFPFAMHNAYFHVVAGESIADDGKIEMSELSVAPRLELYLGGAEYGLGAFYQKDLSPRGMATVSTSLWDIGLFGEAVVSYGSDRVFLRESDTPPYLYETHTVTDEIFFHGTAGGRYSNADVNATLVAQYYFNGEGYQDQELVREIRQTGPALLAPGVLDTASGGFGASTLRETGRHYASVVLNVSELFDTELSTALLWQTNLSDGSGILTPSLSYRVFDGMSISTSATVAYGEDDREYTGLGARTTASVSVNLGRGSF